MRSELIHKIFNGNGENGEKLVWDVFRYQYANNPIYRQFCNALGRPPEKLESLHDIPFLPIRFFKSHKVTTGNFEPETWFESSGTTGSQNSRHYIRSLSLYRESFTRGFNFFYGSPKDWCIIGLLPSYLERKHASLVVMVQDLVKLSGHPESGFYLYDFKKLAETLDRLEQSGQKTLLIGVSFALLDFAEQFPRPLQHTTIMETGGMKGRRVELTRMELHHTLAQAFDHPPIHSEYGMTELLSQAYSLRNGIFHTPSWMQVRLREEDDPLTPLIFHPAGGTRRVKDKGGINVIDLANLDSCAFIATDDIGKLHADGGFEVLGRMDNSDIRGCSLMTL